jgi:uncharacterized protein GlcG (DUF336 family)
MSNVTMAQASIIVDKALEHARAQKFKPLGVAVLDSGGHVVAFKREDKTSIMRFEIAFGKAYGCLGMGFGGREFARRVPIAPHFIQALTAVFDGRVVPVPGGVLIRNGSSEIVGAVGISGDTSENDEACAVAGIKAAGLTPDTGEPA